MEESQFVANLPPIRSKEKKMSGEFVYDDETFTKIHDARFSDIMIRQSKNNKKENYVTAVLTFTSEGRVPENAVCHEQEQKYAVTFGMKADKSIRKMILGIEYLIENQHGLKLHDAWNITIIRGEGHVRVGGQELPRAKVVSILDSKAVIKDERNSKPSCPDGREDVFNAIHISNIEEKTSAAGRDYVTAILVDNNRYDDVMRIRAFGDAAEKLRRLNKYKNMVASESGLVTGLWNLSVIPDEKGKSGKLLDVKHSSYEQKREWLEKRRWYSWWSDHNWVHPVMARAKGADHCGMHEDLAVDWEMTDFTKNYMWAA